MNEIKRKVELYLCTALGERLPGWRILPSLGGSDTADADAQLPPFTVIEAGEAEQMLPQEPTWTVEVTVTYVTHIADTTSPQHSAKVRVLYDAIGAIGRGWHEGQQLRVHGVDIVGTDAFSDDEGRGHGDVITLTMGCTG